MGTELGVGCQLVHNRQSGVWKMEHGRIVGGAQSLPTRRQQSVPEEVIVVKGYSAAGMCEVFCSVALTRGTFGSRELVRPTCLVQPGESSGMTRLCGYLIASCLI